MIPVKPITTCEFISMLQRCKPPTGWPGKLAIANSGGPDSTCLSFLLNDVLRKVKENDATQAGKWFGELISLNVDHQFQPCSSEMSLKTANISHSLGIPHETLQIPWGSPPYTAKPSPGQSFEEIARDARYTLLLSAMCRYGADAIASGHHADDQSEILLMRLENGTGFFGLGGMKPFRRFGMGEGSPGQMGCYGIDGMQRWIIRPMLGVSKDRVLATCEEHGLEYVTDKTNFQPEVTFRNAVRHALARGKITDIIRHGKTLQRAAANAERLGVPLMLLDGIESLRSLAGAYAAEVEMVEAEARTILRDCAVPSPPSTIFLSQDKLSQITNPLTQRSIVIQILRFVSPHPWGSPRAEGSRKLASLDRIVSILFNHCSDKISGKRIAFSAGSHVLWTPVYIKPDGQVKREKPASSRGGWTEGWIASRLPPYTCAIGSLGLDIDITSLILNKRPSGNRVEVLYDNRFILSFDPHAIPEKVFERLRTPSGEHRLVVTATGKYFLPRLVLRSSNGDDIIREIGASDTTPEVGSVVTVSGSDGHSPGAGWVSWRLARVFE
ncbi:hypothetical protein BJ322DRAFT_1208867 [Thelephora terrestris]|uniref:tRNA(Ile)-lysidine synthetase n=1 Tax=Thelephora terrestris TaxID=56493 RepID=A0A9P6HLD5_9AGAM|nr:hypothetical protein BJ322DRAFT_1208867 [Thelephora terrestris]